MEPHALVADVDGGALVQQHPDEAGMPVRHAPSVVKDMACHAVKAIPTDGQHRQSAIICTVTSIVSPHYVAVTRRGATQRHHITPRRAAAHPRKAGTRARAHSAAQCGLTMLATVHIVVD